MPRIASARSLAWAAGTAGSPSAAAVYETRNLALGVDQFDQISNAFIGTTSPVPPRIVGIKSGMAFSASYKGATTVGDNPPPLGALWRAAGATETDGGSTWSYVFANTAYATNFLTDSQIGAVDPIDLQLNINQLKLAPILDAVLDMSIDIMPAEELMFNFTAIGRHGALVWDTEASPSSTATEQNPYPVNMGAGSGLTITHTAPVVTGTATSVTAGTTITSTGATFLSSGVQVGDVITNVSDGSTGGGVITSITSETVLVHTALTGGAGNDWQIGDTFSVASSSLIIGSASHLVRSLQYRLGNSLDERAAIAGTSVSNAYASPRITGRSPMSVMIVEEPPFTQTSAGTIGGAFDWYREMQVAAPAQTRYFTFTYTHNQGGASGQILSLAWSGKLVGCNRIEGGRKTLLELTFAQPTTTSLTLSAS